MRKISIVLTVLLLAQTMFSGVFTMAKAEYPAENPIVKEDANLKVEEDELLVEEDNLNDFLLEEIESSAEDELTEVTEEKDEETSNQLVTPYHHDGHEGFKMEIAEILDGPGGDPYTDDNPLGPNDEFWLRINWELANNHNYNSGDYETIQLPAEIEITEAIVGEELRDEFGNLVATYAIDTNGLVIITFTDYVEEHSNVSGWIELLAQLDQGNAEEENGNIVIGPIGEEGELEVPIDTSEIEKTLEKQGKLNKDYNADEIEWTITFNKNAISLSDVSLEDLLPAGTEYIDGSLEVLKYSASINGNPTGEEISVDITPDITEGKLAVDLGDISDVYVITYRTKVTDMDQREFTNEVTANFNDGEELDAQSTVTINRGEPLEKGVVSHYDPKTGIIEWYLKFNYDQKNLEGVTLADHWEPAGKVELVDGSVTFQEVEIDEHGNETLIGEPLDASEIGSLEKTADGFEVSGITTDKAYYVLYQTKVTERELDGFRLENTASFEDHTYGEGYNIGQYLGLKSAGEIDYANKTIEWTIRINMDERLMKDVIITDTLGDGLTLIDDSISMTVGGEVKTDFVLQSGNPFIISNIGDTDKEIVVTYLTKYDPNELPEDYRAYNTANISWIPDGSKDRINRDIEANKPINQETIDSSWKNASYNPETKEIEWTIIANYRENSYENFTIIDTPQGNQQLMEDSIEVYELTINPDGSISKGDQLSIDPTISGNEFTLEIGQTNKAYGVSYKTSVEGLSELDKEYKNKAQIKDGSEVLSKLEAKASVYGDRKYGDKSGNQDGKQVHWSIDVNLGQELISNLTLIDTISDNQEYLEDTIKVYHASVDKNWNVTKGEELDPSEFNLTVEDNKFTITWKDDVERPFVVEYSTLFFAGHGENVRNDYIITGDGIEEVEGDSKDGFNVQIRQTSTGGAEGKAGYLVIKKLDTTYGQEELPLENIEFELIDPETGAVLKLGETNAEGYIDFGRLLFGDYELREVNVPTGYVAPKESQTITIDKEYIPGEDDPKEYVLEVENYLPNYNIELLKLDNHGNILAGAEFTLFTDSGTVVETKTTDENGKIIFENVEPGHYYIEETKAPEGYELDSTRHPVEVVENQQEPIKRELNNNPIKTSIDVEKLWKGSEEESVTIKLFAEGVKIDSVELNAGNNWRHTFENLLVYNYGTEVTEIEYSIEEVEIDGYSSTIDGNSEEGFTVTNVRSGETEVSVEKVWKGEPEESVTINLLANGEEVASKELNKKNNWTYTFEELPKFDEEGQRIEYTVEEVEIDGYESSITGSQEEGFTVTNLRVGTTEISVKKVWKGSEEESVSVKLLANGEELNSIELNDRNNWAHTFTELPEFDEEGQAIAYTVEEVEIDGYTSEISGNAEEGFTVTNIRSGKTEVSVEKVWKGDPADSVTIDLLANGEKHDTVTLTEESWSHTFEDLAKYDEEGQEIEYIVVEREVEGYESTITGSHAEGYVVTNLRVGETEVSVEKIWKGDPADSATINLLANGEKVNTVTLTEESWSHIFEGLAKYDEEGQPIEYTIEEVEIDGYESSITGSQEEGFTVTNLRTGTVDLTINKNWLDEDETDRPDSITINLLQNGIVLDEYEITAVSDWILTITDLDQFDEEGQEYVYTITEHDVPGYESVIDGFELTNTRVGEKSITITKAWLDGDSKDRPTEIEVELYRSVEGGDRELVDIYRIKEIDGWNLTIDSLPSFDYEGKAYTYEIIEVDLEGYESVINGFDLVNLRVGEIDIAVEKLWKGSEQDSVTIKLLANGMVVDTVELTTNTNWSHIFESLPEFDEKGAAIEYTVEEVELEGYTSEITGDDEEGFTIINTRIGLMELKIDKVWKGDQAIDRPDAIMVDLFRNGDLMTTIIITESDNWLASLTLPKYDDNGEEYVYTVAEHSVDSYDSEVIKTDKGYTITNTFTPQEETPEKPDEGNDLPKTATNMYNYLLIGGLVTLLGAIVMIYARRSQEA